MTSSSSSPADRIKAYYQDYPSSTQFIVGPAQGEATTAPLTQLEQDVEHLKVEEPTPSTEEQQIQALRRSFFNVGGSEVIQRSREKRPHSK